MQAVHEELRNIILKRGIHLTLNHKSCTALLTELPRQYREECKILAQGVLAGQPLDSNSRRS